mmetsp:Transcript_122600/g.261643  ORF Transcript_122600/g.261643 Transcript_122600/m.261643 type:complete len:138 (+) Transcript_122600:76-489(+)
MSLLVEPYNKIACDRNEKERKLNSGEFIQKSREDYLLIHMGLCPPRLMTSPASSTKPRKRAPSESSATRRSPTPSALASPTSGSVTALTSPAKSQLAKSSSLSALPKVIAQDPVQQVLMKGPPLFSPNLASRAAVLY